MLTYIGEIAEAVPFVHRNTISSHINEIFEQDKNLEGVVIGDNAHIDGLVMKGAFYKKIAAKFGYDLFMGRSIELIMDASPLIVDYFTSITDASSLAMNREQDHLYDYVIITKDERFYGIVSIKDLLQTFADIQAFMARYSNPLTGLPGNNLIEENLTKALDAPTYSIFYLDLNHFKAYNDSYGFKQGDVVIRETSMLLQEIFRNHSSNSFLGHIGGDDFIGVIYSHEYESISEQIIQVFDQKVPSFYSVEDWDRGFVHVHDRNNTLVQLPLLSIAIAIVTNQKAHFESTDQISEYATQLKSLCKRTKGSHCVADSTFLSCVKK